MHWNVTFIRRPNDRLNIVMWFPSPHSPSVKWLFVTQSETLQASNVKGSHRVVTHRIVRYRSNSPTQFQRMKLTQASANNPLSIRQSDISKINQSSNDIFEFKQVQWKRKSFRMNYVIANESYSICLCSYLRWLSAKANIVKHFDVIEWEEVKY